MFTAVPFDHARGIEETRAKSPLFPPRDRGQITDQELAVWLSDVHASNQGFPLARLSFNTSLSVFLRYLECDGGVD